MSVWTLSEAAPLRVLSSSFRKSFERAVADHAGRPFVTVYGARDVESRVTFAQFENHVRLAGHRLNELSQGERTVVTVAKNSYEHLVFIAATILTGRTLCPINPDEGPERIAKKISDLGEPALVMVGETQLLEPLGGHALQIGGDAGVDTWSDFPADRPMVLIFTSGSTGYAKIVEQTEIGILTNVDALIERHRLGPGICVGTPLPVFHVNALEFSFFSTLLSGASLVLWAQVQFPQIFDSIAAEKCNIVSVIPQMLRTLLLKPERVRALPAAGLRYWVTAAAPLGADLLEEFVEKTGTRVIQGYGLSEAVNFSCLMPADLDEPDYKKWTRGFKFPSIGTPLRGTGVHILSDDGRELGAGEAGEICIRGPTVMRGYRGDFAKSIFAFDVLHTGDLGLFELDETGNKYFFVTGRKKEIAKRYGMTVSLREVDDVLAAFREPGLDAIAVSFENRMSGEEIGAVMICPPNWSAATEANFIRHIQTQLPPQARPRVIFRTVQALRTASGKPCRHRFLSLFAQFRELSLGNEPRVFEDPR